MGPPSDPPHVSCGFRAAVDLGEVSGAGRGIQTISCGRVEANIAIPKAFSHNQMYSHTMNPTRMPRTRARRGSTLDPRYRSFGHHACCRSRHHSLSAASLKRLYRPSPKILSNNVHLIHTFEGTTGRGPLSNSDFGMSRSSIFRMGKVGGGVEIRHPRTDHFPFRPDIRTSHNSRNSSRFDESRGVSRCAFTKRLGDFISSRHSYLYYTDRPSVPAYD